MTKDKTGKSPRRRRKPENPDSVVFSSNRSVLDGYAKRGTSVALSSEELDSNFFKKLTEKLTQQKEARYE